MNGITFHAEMPEARKSKSASKSYPHQPWTRATLRKYADAGQHVNVIAVLRANDCTVGQNGRNWDSVSAVTDTPNSGVCGCGVSDGYLRERTTRIDEQLARRLHPALFVALDLED